MLLYPLTREFIVDVVWLKWVSHVHVHYQGANNMALTKCKLTGSHTDKVTYHYNVLSQSILLAIPQNNLNVLKDYIQ